MLTDTQIRKIKPTIGKKAPDKYSDGDGLYLHVFESGGALLHKSAKEQTYPNPSKFKT